MRKEIADQRQHYEAYYSTAESDMHTKNAFKFAFIERLIELCNFSQKDNVLEIGCGSGILTSKILERGARVTAIDISQEGIRYLRERNAGYVERKRLTLEIVEINTYLRNTSERYSWIVGGGILHHLSNLEETFHLVSKCLANNGSIFFAPEPNASGMYYFIWKYLAKHFYKLMNGNFDWEIEKGTLNMTMNNLTALLKQSGFSEIDILPYQVIPHFNLKLLRAIDRFLVEKTSMGQFSLYLAILARKTI